MKKNLFTFEKPLLSLQRAQRRKIIPPLVALHFLALTCASLPAEASAPPPNTGRVLEDVIKPPLLQPEKRPAPPVKISEPQANQPLHDGPKIWVRDFRLTGDCPVPASELLSILERDLRQELTLGQLQALGEKLTQKLRQDGYLVAFVFLPAQEITDGTVTYQVVPGRYGKLVFTNHSRVKDDVLHTLFATLSPGAVISQQTLDRALLLAGDLPGLNIKTTLTPGQTPGTSDLLVEATDDKAQETTLYADNWGGRYTGATRYGAQMRFLNLSGGGDELSLGGLSTFRGLTNYDFSYGTRLGNRGLRLLLRHSRVDYRLGDTFAALDATGQATTSGLSLQYPLIRSRTQNLDLALGFESKKLRDDIDAVSTHVPKTTKLWNLSLSGNSQESSGSVNSFSLTYTRGHLGINDETVAASDAATACTAGEFSKITLSLQRRQYISERLQLNLSLNGQFADGNLDSSEKFYLGGPTGIRAYPQGESPGDEGYRVSAELRLRLGRPSPSHALFALGYIDCGAVTVNKNPWPGAGTNHRFLKGAGLGLLWTCEQNYAIRLDYAWKLGHEPAVSEPDASGRFWLQGVRYF